MTRKRLRYSELVAPEAAAPVEAALPAEATAPASPLVEPPAQDEAFAVERDDDAPLIGALGDPSATFEKKVVTEAEPTPTRRRRNSTPVELARTLTAERAAARALEGASDDADNADIPPADGEPTNEPPRSLRERARTRSGTADLLMFRVGGEHFAIELILVEEVVDLPIIHHVPEMPPAMVGVVTVRGALTPVYSPEHALGLPLAHRDALLIFRRGAHRVGILIDDVDDALSVDLAELREKPAGEEGDKVLLGVVRLANTLVGIIDVDALIISCQSANILEPA
jgi:purine-binding chemotaxis protein CheW